MAGKHGIVLPGFYPQLGSPWLKQPALEDHQLVGGLEHLDYFSIQLGIVTPTDELIFFTGVGWNHQPEVLSWWSWYLPYIYHIFAIYLPYIHILL